MSVTLNTLFATSSADILKMDVEGHEKNVLEGGSSFFSDENRAPRLLYIEMHRCYWRDVDSEFKEILNLIQSFEYQGHYLDGKPVLKTGNIPDQATFEIVCKKRMGQGRA